MILNKDQRTVLKFLRIHLIQDDNTKNNNTLEMIEIILTTNEI